jgi:hypothetical protein
MAIGIGNAIIFKRGGGGFEFDAAEAPDNLILTVVSDTEIKLDWTDNSDNEEGFRIYISTDGISFTEKGTVLADVETYSATGLTQNTLYYFYVVAYTGGSESDPTLTEQAQTEPTFGLYASFFGADNTFSDGETIAEGTYGVKNGNLYVHDKSTGQIALASNLLTGFGDADWTDTILYGSAIALDYGRVFRFSFISPVLITTFRAGLLKTDLSDAATSLSQIYSATTGAALYTLTKFIEKLDYSEYEFAFIIGGFDVSGNPYQSGSKDGFTFGYYLFMRGIYFSNWFLVYFKPSDISTSVVPFFAFYSTNISPFQATPVMKMMTYKLNDFQFIPTGYIALSNNDQFTGFDINDTLLIITKDIADGEEVDMYFCIDDYTIPTEGYRLNFARSTNTIQTLYRIDDSVETSLAVSLASAGGTGEVTFKFYKGIIFGYNSLANFAGVDISVYSSNTKAKIVDGANSHLTFITWYSFGADNPYSAQLRIQEPFHIGATAPGFGLPAEARKGHYFDVSSQSTSWGVESVGVIAYLVNGSDKMRVRFRSHSEQRFVPELDVTLTLRFAYAGTDAIIYIGSDPHWGYVNQDANLVYSNLVIPDITDMGVTHCFVLGDIVHDVDKYDDYIAAKGLYPSATWYELNGNHDVIANFRTKLGYGTPIDYVVSIGNCAFCMVEYDAGDKSAAIAAMLDANATNNCFIMSHIGRKDTTVSTDSYYMNTAANIDTELATRKFVAWFAAHQHGWVENTRKLTTAKYLNLGDNN